VENRKKDTPFNKGIVRKSKGFARSFGRLQFPKTMDSYPHSPLGIKSWAEEDRPREKLLRQGKSNLTDAELLAILLRSGSPEESAVGLAKRILAGVDQDLHALGRCSIAELTRYKGMGKAKAITVAAALELGRRRQLADLRRRPCMRSSQDAYQAIAPLIADLPHEEFWLLLLNRANRITARERISTGGVSGTVVDAKIVFRKAVEGLASSVILCHNHPSGNLQPSQADLDLTRKLKQAGQVLDVCVLDHLIVAEGGYTSFSDEGLL